MPTYVFKGRNRLNEMINGEREAASESGQAAREWGECEHCGLADGKSCTGEEFARWFGTRAVGSVAA